MMTIGLIFHIAWMTFRTTPTSITFTILLRPTRRLRGRWHRRFRARRGSQVELCDATRCRGFRRSPTAIDAVGRRSRSWRRHGNADARRGRPPGGMTWLRRRRTVAPPDSLPRSSTALSAAASWPSRSTSTSTAGASGVWGPAGSLAKAWVRSRRPGAPLPCIWPICHEKLESRYAATETAERAAVGRRAADAASHGEWASRVSIRLGISIRCRSAWYLRFRTAADSGLP